MQIKTTLIFHLIPVEWLLPTKQKITNGGKDGEKKEPVMI